MKKNMNRNVIIALLVAGLVVTLVGCDHETDRLLERAEAYLPAEPDSAEMCLNGIEEPARLGDEPRALYGLLRTYVENRQGKEVKSDSLIRDSYEYYREVSDAGQTSDKELMRHYAQSCYYMALYYSSCDSTKQCEDLLHQAIKCSEKCEDWHTCYVAYTQLGHSTIWGNPEYAIQQSLKALETYHKINDDVNNEVLILGKIAVCYLTFAEPDSALMYFNMGEKLAEKNHLEKSQNEMYMGMSDTYHYMGEYEKALDYAKQGVKTAEGQILVSSLFSLAQCYQACDSLEKAREILDTICHDPNPMHKYFVFRDLSKIAIRQQNMIPFMFMWIQPMNVWKTDSCNPNVIKTNIIKPILPKSLRKRNSCMSKRCLIGFGAPSSCSYCLLQPLQYIMCGRTSSVLLPNTKGRCSTRKSCSIRDP